MRRGLVWGLVAVYLALWVVGIEVQRHAQIPLSAQQIQASLDKVYEKSRAASVRIETIPEGIGSGFFISSDGYVMTAYHVIEGAKVLNVRTARDEVLRAEVVGYDEPRDLAILRVRPSRAVPFLALETQRALQPRDLVLGIGNSRGDFIAPRPGVVTQLDRTLSPFFPAGLVASTSFARTRAANSLAVSTLCPSISRIISPTWPTTCPPRVMASVVGSSPARSAALPGSTREKITPGGASRPSSWISWALSSVRFNPT